MIPKHLNKLLLRRVMLETGAFSSVPLEFGLLLLQLFKKKKNCCCLRLLTPDIISWRLQAGECYMCHRKTLHCVLSFHQDLKSTSAHNRKQILYKEKVFGTKYWAKLQLPKPAFLKESVSFKCFELYTRVFDFSSKPFLKEPLYEILFNAFSNNDLS